MPLSITLHHAATDGYHVKIFLEDLQDEMNHPERWTGEKLSINEKDI